MNDGILIQKTQSSENTLSFEDTFITEPLPKILRALADLLIMHAGNHKIERVDAEKFLMLINCFNLNYVVVGIRESNRERKVIELHEKMTKINKVAELDDFDWFGVTSKEYFDICKRTE
jgi:hypothetical protein